MTTDLFSLPEFKPLAEQLRPKSLAEFVGQTHLLDSGRPLNLAFSTKRVHSMILWGPPGVGKTTLARLFAQAFECEWVAVSAVMGGVKEIREAVQHAQRVLQQAQRQTILFIDEIHRFNNSQQDALLPFVESGLVTFVGATTENPSFEINSALLSRAQVYVLQPLDEQAFSQLFARAQQQVFPRLHWADEARALLIQHADGDARRFLNRLEQVILAAQAQGLSQVDAPLLEQVMSAHVHRFDKQGEQFYDQISALHKSVRGSNPDAALYWLCRMLAGGVDPKYLARRIVRIAWEDIGLADPRAMTIANEAALTYERLGSPEGELALAQAVIYLSVAAKSYAGYQAYNRAMAFVKQDQSREVPLHLRNAPTTFMKNLGYGRAYRYAHDEPQAYAAGEHYFPEGMENPNWYVPVERGLEIKIREKLAYLRRLDQLAHESE